MNQIVLKDYSEYLEFAKSLFTITKDRSKPFRDIESWDIFFDANLPVDKNENYKIYPDKYTGRLGNAPKDNEFPVILTYHFEVSYFRGSKDEIQIFEWKSLKDLGLKIGG